MTPTDDQALLKRLSGEWRGLVVREQRSRDMSFIALTENIGPFEIRQLTLRDYNVLRYFSPFFSGGEVGRNELFVFLWAMSPEYSPTGWRAKRKLLRRCRCFWWHPFCTAKVKAKRIALFTELEQRVREYIDDSIMDTPGTDSKFRPSYWSDMAATVDTIAHSYGWNDDTILDTPIKRLLQYRKCIIDRETRATGKRASHFNPSDIKKSEYLEAVNKE